MATSTQQFMTCDKCHQSNGLRHLNLHTCEWWFECPDCGWGWEETLIMKEDNSDVCGFSNGMRSSSVDSPNPER